MWYSDLLAVVQCQSKVWIHPKLLAGAVAAVMRRIEEVWGLRSQAGAQRFVAAQHRRQILGLLCQLLHLLPQGGILLLQVLTLLETRREGMLEKSCFIYYKSVCFLCEVKLDSMKVMVFTTCS